jgi:hypothetical protein
MLVPGLRLRLLLLLCVSFSVALPAQAEPPSLERIPDVLEPWIPWVLEGAGSARCPLIGDVPTCVWPSQLELSADDHGASFTLRVTTDDKQQVTLPGSEEQWPEDVQVDGKPAAVLDGGAPYVLLERGAHVIKGRFDWPEMPDSLAAPANLGVLSLTLRGSHLSFPKRESSGLIWLARAEGREDEADRLELRVQRKLDDGVPLVTVTRIHVSAAGKAREVVLPSVLIPGTRAIELKADLPAQLSPEGSLRLKAQPGDYCVTITAIRETPTDELTAPNASAPWPDRETWVWSADDRLRHVELEGAPQIDPARTDLDQDWHGLPTFVVERGKSLTLVTRRRGEPEPPPNQITLSRGLWLDLDGDGYTVSDQLTGTIHRGFRIDLSEGELGHASVDGADQLITVHDGKSGVELRKDALSLTTEWRMPHGHSTFPAVGYSEDVQSLSTELHLPPGFRLLGVDGVDHVAGTWLDGWDLWDFFFVLLMSLAAGKLAGRPFFVVALLALVLTHHDYDAPGLAWVFLLVSTALLQVVKARGRFEKAARVLWGLALVGFVLVAVPFAVKQARIALYPHLEHEMYMPNLGGQSMSLVPMDAEAAVAPSAPPAPEGAPEQEQEVAKDRRSEWEPPSEAPKRKAGFGSGSSYGGASTAYSRSEVDPNAVVQTGPGVPTWNYTSFSLGFSGPVEKGQRIKLWLVTPAFTRLWSILNVALCAALLAALALATRKKIKGLSQPPPPAAALIALVALTSLTFVGSAHAQDVPSPEVLEELKQRLLSNASCQPNCIGVERLDLTVEGSRLTLRARVHAGAFVSYQAPGPLETWAPESVRLDGKDAFALIRADDGFLHVRLEPGLHTVELVGPLPSSQVLTLALGTPPHRVSAQAKGWAVEGLRADGRVEGSLVLRREVEVESSGDGAVQPLAQWLEVTRELDLGVRFRVRTVIQRLGPSTDSMLLRLPLLPGESVLDNNVNSDGKTALVELPRDAQVVTISSSLRVSEQLDLRAALPKSPSDTQVTRPWNETWVVRCGALYRCEFEGIAPVSRSEDGHLAFTYEPWPGEAVTIHARHLDAAKGTSVTIDHADLELTPGSRMEQAKLTLQVRTSRGTTERIDLPEASTLTSLTVDGQARPARVLKNALEVALDPGSHTLQVMLQRAQGMRFAYSPGAVRASRPLVNARTTVTMPSDRWLLWTRGPDWGPAVLFWGYLLVVLLAAVALSRVPHSPLKVHEWLLLSLGLTQVDAWVSVVIVGWLFLLSLRARTTLERPLAFNTAQVAIILFTLLALGCLAFAVHRGLVVQPDMQVQGMNSTNESLSWYVDRTEGGFPTLSVFSVPLWIYKALMLVWALWLAASLLRWLRWGFTAFRTGGAWKSLPKRERPENPRVPLDQIASEQERLATLAPKPAPKAPEEPKS